MAAAGSVLGSTARRCLLVAPGSGESEIRRYVLENDLVEAIIALPTDMFYNTGISTYVWANFSVTLRANDVHRTPLKSALNRSAAYLLSDGWKVAL
jgi:hypothetical protein